MLIDKYLPEFQFNEVHSTEIGARPANIYPFLKSVDFSRSRVIRLLFTMRGLPREMCSLDGFVKTGFTLLEEKDGEEIVIGLLFRAMKFEPVPASPDEFRAFTERGYVKAVMNFFISQLDDRSSLVSTESRVFCTSTKARLMFTPYWLLISRFSGLIRIMMLRLVRQEAERAARVQASGKDTLSDEEAER